jgi:hypothetical protein
VASCEICGGQSGIGAGLSSQFFGFPQPFVIPLLHHSHPALRAELCDSPEQAEYYRSLGLMGGFISDPANGWSLYVLLKRDYLANYIVA